jgi:hypothetical protein
MVTLNAGDVGDKNTWKKLKGISRRISFLMFSSLIVQLRTIL